MSLSWSVGCDRKTDTAKAVEEAHITLASLDGSGGQLSVPETMRSDSYQKVVSSLEPVLSSTSIEGERGAANLLLARAHAGLGDIATAKAVAAENACADAIQNIRTSFDVFLAHHSRAAALASYDPTADLADITAKIGERRAEIEAATQHKATQVAAVEALRAEAASFNEQAKIERDAETAIRREAADVSETRREELLKQATVRKRAADALEGRAADVLAKAALDAPKIEEAQLDLDRLNDQLGLLEQSKASLTTHAETVRAQAREIRDLADAAGARVVEMFTALEALREATTGPMNEAAEAFQAATSAAQAASGVDTQIAAGSYEHSRADVLMNRARGLNAFSELCTLLAASQPPVPGLDGIAEKAQQAGEAAASAHQDATDAYRSARDAFEGASSDHEETQKHLDAVTAALNKLTGDGDEAAAGGDSADAPSDLSVPDQIRAELASVSDSVMAGDLTALKGRLSSDDSTTQEMLAKVDGLLDAVISLNEACKASFSTDLAETFRDQMKANGMGDGSFSSLPMLAGNPNVAMLQNFSLDDLEITEVGPDEATVSIPESPEPVTVRRTGGKWVIVLPPAEAGEAELAMGSAILDEVTSMISDTAAKVADKTIGTPQDLFMSMSQQIMGLVAKAMQDAQQMKDGQ